MSNNIVTVKNLAHRYSVHWAVKNINFDILNKGVTGLLGSNGAGKSTTMNIICGALNQTEGEVYIDGINMAINPTEAKKHIGFLPQTPPLYKDLTVDEYLTHSADLRFVNYRDIKRAVNVAKDKCSISHFSDRLIKNLSGGYQQRVGIAQAIVHTPKLVILDEPTNGLDPNQIVDVRRLIKDISEEHCVLLSTHILSEVQALCHDIKMIENGRLVFSDTMDSFNNYIKPEGFTVELNNPPSIDIIKEQLNVLDVLQVDVNVFRVKYNEDTKITQELIKLSYSNGWDLKEIAVDRCSLDEVFAQLSGKVVTEKTIK